MKASVRAQVGQPLHRGFGELYHRLRHSTPTTQHHEYGLKKRRSTAALTRALPIGAQSCGEITVPLPSMQCCGSDRCV
ncbi:uncharacterized protein M421DRAFT_331724 [Didymella exigua CBS 183.55]|uniref:Uncharacterized protein n=1 Tax=Didymella exigua CBS 183.55 TaxID=1150837 RepID=A0A6A5R4V6_9PLEO|nr:uncharacterized protein M421DRAFT_331724 [Didymella exigua CBS 183.55]KAF1923141.1 hypothetical protein M421DRAFT_331724 [Didymella exigua CBS 183.55]